MLVPQPMFSGRTAKSAQKHFCTKVFDDYRTRRFAKILSHLELARFDLTELAVRQARVSNLLYSVHG
jgi:hypothetical protein